MSQGSFSTISHPGLVTLIPRLYPFRNRSSLHDLSPVHLTLRISLGTWIVNHLTITTNILTKPSLLPGHRSTGCISSFSFYSLIHDTIPKRRSLKRFSLSLLIPSSNSSSVPGPFIQQHNNVFFCYLCKLKFNPLWLPLLLLSSIFLLSLIKRLTVGSLCLTTLCLL